MQEKEIIVTNLSSKVITPKPGATWKAFTVYQIQGNDGILYETTLKDFYDGLKLGQSLHIKFIAETKTVNGKVYTSYKLQLPKKADPAIGELKNEIFAKLDEMKKDIISAFRLIKTEVKVEKNPKQASLFPEDIDDDEGARMQDGDGPEY